MRCKLDRVRFKGTDGFSVFSYHTQDPDTPESARHFSRLGKSWYTFTAVGYGMPDTDAVDVELDGKWENSKYGLQLHVSSCREVAPRTVKSILAYLCSGLIKGIGPETAKAIVAKFGTQTIDVLENEPERLLEVKGIAKAKLATIMRSYEQTRTLREITEYLSPFGVSLKKIHKIQETFGDDSLRIVKTDPFQLCKIKGFGFLTVDEIARKTRVSLQHPLRYVGAMLYLLDEAMGAGHLFLPVEELESKCYDLLNRDCQREVVSVSDIHAAVVKAHMDKLIYNEKGRVYKFFERQCEVQVAKRVVSLLLQERPIEIPNITAEIKASEKALHQQLAPSQRTAVELCLTHSISIITGGPGVGKTTTLRVILDIYHRVMPDNEILLAAPTGKASRRMHEQTGYPASTLHSAMGIMYDADLAAQEYELLTADLVIVDECSMVDMRLAYALFQRLKPGAQLILVGDPDQLPSVGPGNVLREMIRSQMIPTAVLDIVFRQASNSRIALNAHAVNHNDTHLLYGDDFIFCDVKTSDEALSLILKYYVQEVSQNGIGNVQILSPQRKKGTVCANRLNSEIRDLVNPPRAGRAEIKCGGMTYRVGDRVIQTRNQEEVANGEVGVITAITGDGTNDPVIEITLLDGRVLNYSADMLEDVDLSYCISIHKSQGAEFPVVLIPILKEHYIMLRRNLLYTAISRAKSKVMLADASEKKMDLILCASVSRFARNVSDCIDQVRKLRTMNPSHPVGVYFETENIYTLDPDSDQSLQVHALLADWESANKSRRMILSYDQRICTGQYPVLDLLGLRHTKDGDLVIEPEEAKTVKFIFLALLLGHTPEEVAEVLTQKQRPTLRGRTDWNASMVRNVTTNERRWGDLQARKTIVIDYKAGKVAKNNNDRDAAFIPDHHEGIVSREIANAMRYVISSSRQVNGISELTVIDQGALKGFVSISPGWSGIDRKTFLYACRSVYSEAEWVQIEEEAASCISCEHSNVLSMTLTGYEVPRGVFFMGRNTPTLTMSNRSLSFNRTCHERLGNCEFIEVLYHPVLQTIVVRESDDSRQNAVRWVNDEGKPTSYISAKAYANSIYEEMGWICDYRFRFRGISRDRGASRVIFFYLEEPRIIAGKRARGTESDSDLSQENGAIRYIPYKADESAQADEVGDFNYARAYPEEWMDGNIGVSMELRKRRDQIAHIVTEADIAQEGVIVVNPMIGELPAMEEVQEEFEQLLLSM